MMFDDHDEVEQQFMAVDYNYTEDKNNGGDTNDGHANDNDGTDVLCALCDDGGKLLSCTGQCKRSFHPRKKDGRESKCKTLGYTSEKLMRIGTYVCKNCKYKKHQCFKCGELEPSDGPNAKVFKCKDSSCGHFYHPKCVAKLLEPDDFDGNENCELAKRIMAGMPFTCPVHWCFECGRMEDRTQRALQFAVCRRCPKSYHRECLPRGISFDTKNKQVKQRAWELSKIIMIYCLDHKICKATGNAKRGHIKFPIIPKISKVSNLCKKRVKMIGKRKRSIGQCSKKSVVSKRLSRENNEHTKKAAADSSIEYMVLKPENPVMSLKKDLHLEPSVIGAADPNVLETSRGQGKQFENLPSFVMGTGMPSPAVGSKSGKSRRSKPHKGTSSRTLCNFAKKYIVASDDTFGDFVQQDILLKRPSSSKDAGLENEICKIPEDKEGNKKEKSSEHYSEKRGATNEVISCENGEQNDVPRKVFVDKHAEGNQSKLKSINERIMLREEMADGCNSVLGQEEDIYMTENQLCKRPNEQDSKSEGKIARNDSSTSVPGNVGVTPDHVDVLPEKHLIVRHVPGTTHKIDSQPDYRCTGYRRVLNGGNACQEEPNSSQCNGNSKAADIDVSVNQSSKVLEFKRNVTDVNNTELEKNRRCIGDGGAHHGDTNHQYPSEFKQAETSECKARQGAGSSRREHLTCSTEENSSNSPMGRNAQKKPMNHLTEGQRSYSDLFDQNPGNNNQYRYEQQCQVNYSSNDPMRCSNMWAAFPPPGFGAGQCQVNYCSNDLKTYGNMWSALTPAGFGAGQCHGHFSYLRGPEHGITGWQSPPFHPRSHGYFNSSWHSPDLYPRRPELADYTTYQNNSPVVNHGEYHAMGTDPASRYSPRVDNNGAYQPRMDVSMRGHGATYDGRYGAYGVRANYAFGWGPRTPAGGSVTNWYAPRLEQTNHQPRGWTTF